jgi:hypothetical protein
LMMSTINAPESPLSDVERRAAVKRAKRIHARQLMSLAIRKGEFLTAVRLSRRAGLTANEVLMSLKPVSQWSDGDEEGRSQA